MQYVVYVPAKITPGPFVPVPCFFCRSLRAFLRVFSKKWEDGVVFLEEVFDGFEIDLCGSAFVLSGEGSGCTCCLSAGHTSRLNAEGGIRHSVTTDTSTRHKNIFHACWNQGTKRNRRDLAFLNVPGCVSSSRIRLAPAISQS